ncbi:hypothetical protein IWX85_002854 [Polaromonas sp. CG_9.11]|nr:hypothetical protein [Polaromonas sp. CG_9.11]
MPVAGWFDRSFANSFTLCLIWFTRAARVAVSYRLRLFFLSLTCWVQTGGSVGVEQRLPFLLSPVSRRPALAEKKKGKKLPAVLGTQKKRSSRA